ncbi:terminase small subunit [Rhodospirillales bacterium]|nr:terminase small subunit [Rhodospirillales bacterium]
MTPLSKELSLPPRQAHFVEAYCMGQNATKAAMAAGYSIKTADVQGSRMLRNVKIFFKNRKPYAVPPEEVQHNRRYANG